MNYSLVPMDENTKAAILFVDDQLLLRYRDQGRLVNKFISPEAAKDAFNLIPTDSGWVPDNTIRHGLFRGEPFSIIHFPAASRTISVEIERKVQSVTRNFPAGVFAGFGNNFYIFAVKGEKFSLNAPLFHYPLPNICERTGLICFGSYNPKANLSAINESLNLFFRATFNDHHIKGKSKKYPNDIREALLQKRLPLSNFLPLDQTAEEIFNYYLNR